MKKSILGCPSSDKMKDGAEKMIKSLISLFEESAVRFLKYGAQLDKAMTRAE